MLELHLSYRMSTSTSTNNRIGDQASLLSFPTFFTLALFAILIAVVIRIYVWKLTSDESVAIFVRSQPDRSPTSITINISHSCIPSLRLPPSAPSPSSASIERYTGIVEPVAATLDAAGTLETKKTV